MYHYGNSDDMKPIASFDTYEDAEAAAQDASIYSDAIIAVWPDYDDANPEALAWGGTVYRT